MPETGGREFTGTVWSQSHQNVRKGVTEEKGVGLRAGVGEGLFREDAEDGVCPGGRGGREAARSRGGGSGMSGPHPGAFVDPPPRL